MVVILIDLLWIEPNFNEATSM